MRVLGVDPGLTRCGLGVVEGSGGRQVRCVAVDVVRSPSATRARCTPSIATLMMSAALPWIGALSAIRSAISRRCRLSLVRSGR